MPAAIPIAIALGTAGGAAIAGSEESKGATKAAGTQATAATQAAGIQANTTAQALQAQQEQQQYARTQYANYLGRMQPYEMAGNQAVTTLQQALSGGIPSVRN